MVRTRLESRTIALLNDARNVEVGKRIREARRYAGLSQAALARTMNPPVTEKAVQQWENGTFAADRKRLEAIAKATRVPGGWEFLYRGTEMPPVSPDLIERIERLTSDVAKLNRRIDELEGDGNGGGAIAEPF